ncbi:MAG: hypothetical protein US49_C0001G0269 [candidate division TM6 bacterium GW2011_GWF2_37_49]|nr:MAG: hypothetical protein US49_C0001G0269 [candidate division TM6 bacterium GW2011_GWF2_37_49]
MRAAGIEWMLAAEHFFKKLQKMPSLLLALSRSSEYKKYLIFVRWKGRVVKYRFIIFVLLIFCSNLYGATADVDKPSEVTQFSAEKGVTRTDVATQSGFWNVFQNWVVEPIKNWVVNPIRTAGHISIEFLKPYFMKTWTYVAKKSTNIKPQFGSGQGYKKLELPISPNALYIATVDPTLTTAAVTMPQHEAALTEPDTIALTGRAKFLQYFAETFEYGYKTANLMLLKELVAGINWIEIPDFVAVSSPIIQALLSAHGIDVAARWGVICEGVEQGAVMTQRKIPETFLTKLAELENEIKAKFDEVSEKFTPEQFLQLFDPKIFPDVSKLFSQKNIKLVVRSTGPEDTDNVANAGGNESVKNVAPIIKEIMHAMGIVVASYFSAKSFGQRLIAGDIKLFNLPMTPVLIQKMIGEVEGEPIPSAGVMYTEEAEGGWSRLRQANPGFKKTTGITVIQATYGYNEGVVNGLVPIDSFYVSADYIIHEVIKRKHVRIVPAHDTPIPNLAEIADKPALNADVIYKLKSIANRLEKFYGKPMDVEFVYHPTTTKISIVQARPITYKKNLLPPCFLTYSKDMPGVNIGGTTIGCGGGSVRVITNKNQVIFASTLREALQIYLKMNGPAHVSCVITENMAPTTSHEANTFRIEGKAVVCVTDSAALKELKAAIERGVLVIDPQTGRIYIWHGPQKSLEALRADGFIKEGSINYPIPLQLSIPISTKKLNVDMKRIIKELQQGVDETIITNFEKMPSVQLLDVLKEAPEKGARAALAALLIKIVVEEERLKNLVAKNKLAPELLRHFNILSQAEAGFVQEIATTLQFPSLDVRRLYAVRFLEALMLQEHSPDVVNGYSFEQLDKIIGHEWKIITKSKILDPVSVQLAKVGSVAFTPETKAKWLKFVKDLASLPEPADVTPKTSVKNRFARMIAELNQHDIITLWLHLSFDPATPPEAAAAAAEVPAVEQAKRLIVEFDQSKRFLDVLAMHRQNIEQFDTSAFENPKSFTPLTAQLRGLMTYFIGDEFLGMFQKSERLGKLAALNLMNVLVDKFDSSLKTLEGSPKYPPDLMENVTNFKALLEIYFVLLQRWSVLLPKSIDISRAWNTIQAEHVLKGIDDGLKNIELDNPVKQIKPSRFFDALGFVIWGLDQGLSGPTTLEDIFTAIHQNLLTIHSILIKDLRVANIKLPELVQDINQKILKSYDKSYLVSLSFNQNIFKFKYNFPLRVHCGIVDFMFNIKTFSSQIICKFMGNKGETNFNRWEIEIALARIIEYFYNVKVTNIEMNSCGVTLTFNFHGKCKYVDMLSNVLSLMCDAATYSNWDKHVFWNTFLSDPKFIDFLIFNMNGILQPFSFLLEKFKNNEHINTKIMAMIWGTLPKEEEAETAQFISNNQLVVQDFVERLKDQIRRGNPSADERLLLLIQRFKDLKLEDLFVHVLDDITKFIQALIKSDPESWRNIKRLCCTMLENDRLSYEAYNFVLKNLEDSDWMLLAEMINLFIDFFYRHKDAIEPYKSLAAEFLNNKRVCVMSRHPWVDYNRYGELYKIYKIQIPPAQ